MLYNVKWSDQYLYMQTMSLLSQLKVSSSGWYGDESKFNLHKLHGKINNGMSYYFLTSKQWPTWVASMRLTGQLGSTTGMFALNLDKPSFPHDPQGIVVHICRMTKAGFEDTVMIMSSGSKMTLGTESKAYIHQGSWFVYGWVMSSDPGTGGYWKPNKPILGLELC